MSSASLLRAGAPRDHCDKRRVFSAADLTLVIVAVATAVLVVNDVQGPVRIATGAIAALLVPGWAVVRWFRARIGRILAVAITVGLGAVLAAIVGSIMLAVSVWDPTAYVIVVCGVSVIATVIPAKTRDGAGVMELLRRRQGGTVAATGSPPSLLSNLILLAVLVVAIVVWLAVLRPVTATGLGEFGLLPVYSRWWYIALASIVVIAGLGYVWRLPIIQAAGIAAFTLVLYASPAIIEAAPRLSYVYKHVAVVRLFEVTGTLHPNVDLYNRWPGFFAASALFDTWTGIASPISYVAFAETGFALANAGLIFLLAQGFAINTRNALLAASLFTAVNWVGQGYFSPQAFTFTLFLLMAVLITRFLHGDATRFGGWIERLLARVVRVQATAAAGAFTPAGNEDARPQLQGPLNVAVVVLVLLLQATIVISHQLTPYMVVFGILPLGLIGYIRPRILGVIFLAMNLAFLAPNFQFLQQNYDLFSGFNFFQNATVTLRGFGTPTVAHQIQSQVVGVLTAIVALLAVTGFVLRARTGDLRPVAIVAWMSLSPLLILVVQSYGGEGRLRAVLFALPWWTIGVAWLAQWKGWPSGLCSVVFGVSAVVIVSLFTFAWLQPEADNVVSKSDVEAAQWINDHVTAKDQLSGALPRTTLDDLVVDWRYPVVYATQPASYGVRAALEEPLLDSKLSGVRASVAQLTNGSKIYIVFSAAQNQNAAMHYVAGNDQLGQLETEIAALPTATLAYENSGDRIYALTANN